MRETKRKVKREREKERGGNEGKKCGRSRKEGRIGGKEGVLFMPPPLGEVFRRKSTTPGCV